MNTFHRFLLFVCTLFLFASCGPKVAPTKMPQDAHFKPVTHKETIQSIHIIDRNGLSETITAKDRLKTFENVDFLSAQPYQKVLCVFTQDKSGSSRSMITSYHPNGQLKQYLEAINGRARGTYGEWHINGKKKLVCRVIAGAADIDEKSQLTWSFEGISRAWNEEGSLLTEIPYDKGELNGVAKYYYPKKKNDLSKEIHLSQEIPYTKGVVDGVMRRFAEEGSLLEESHFVQGEAHGASTGFWMSGIPQWEEQYVDGLLEEGSYFDKEGVLLCQVQKGNGKRAVFLTPKEPGEVALEFQQFTEGRLEGKIEQFDEKNVIILSYFIKDGLKHGLETRYYPTKPFLKEKKPQAIPKLSIEWYEGKVHGIVKTWYENGVQESQKEMSDNSRHGMLTCWYKDKSLMCMEEYERDKLIRGEYHKRGETACVSRVVNGKGVVTLFDGDGHFSKKIKYNEGKPVEDV